MKRGLIFIFFVFLIMSSFFVVGQDTEASIDDNKDESIGDLEVDLEKAGERAKEAGSGIRKNIDEKITKEIEIPDSLQILARIIFGIKDEKIQLNLLMINLGVWILFLIIIFKVSEFIPFLDKSSTLLKILFSAIVTMLASLTGAISLVVSNLFGLATLFKALEDFSSLATVIVIVILVGIFWVANKLIKIFEHKLALSNADAIAEKSQVGIKVTKQIGEEIGK